MRQAAYQIVNDTPQALTIRDVGHDSGYMTVTNAAESVVEELVKVGKLVPGKRLFYYDSEEDFSELLHEAGKFKGYAPVVAP